MLRFKSVLLAVALLAVQVYGIADLCINFGVQTFVAYAVALLVTFAANVTLSKMSKQIERSAK